MKAQFALFEVLISIILLSATGAVISFLTYSSTLNNKSINFNYPNAFYDFSNIIYKNESVSLCVANLSNACAVPILQSFNSLFRFTYSKIVVNNVSVSYGNPSSCKFSTEKCFPVSKNDTSSIACLSICGD